MTTFHITLSKADGHFRAECPELPGCTAQGRTEPEAMLSIKEAITAWFWDRDRHAQVTSSQTDFPVAS